MNPMQLRLLLMAANPRNVGRVCRLVGDMPNVESPTMGGRLVWKTLRRKKGFRLQRNVLTDHWRILDGDNVRVAWGAQKAMKERFEEFAP